MSLKIKLTRPELKRQRDDLKRFKRYLPMLKLKQQILQLAVRETTQRLAVIIRDYEQQQCRMRDYVAVLADTAGFNLEQAAKPVKVNLHRENIAGAEAPVFVGVEFTEPLYAHLGAPVWVEQTLQDLRRLAELRAEADLLVERRELLQRELTRTMQRVNLFEEVKIPQALEAMRIIRIYLGDQMTAMVGRSKMAKNRLSHKGKAQ